MLVYLCCPTVEFAAELIFFQMPINRNPGPRGDRVSLFCGLQALLRTPFFLPIIIAVLFIGAGDAVGGSYLTLFAVDQGRMNLQFEVPKKVELAIQVGI